MAADLSQDSVLRFLQGRGGSAKNSELLLHFKSFIRDHEDRSRNRELFKRYVNAVATVRQDGGVAYVALKKQFQGCVPAGGGGGAGPPWVPAGSSSGLKTAAPPGRTPGDAALPAAGIAVNNNNNNTPVPAGQVARRPGPGPGPKTPAPDQRGGFGPLPVAPVIRQQVPAPQTLAAGLHQEPPLRVSLDPEVAPRCVRYRPSYKSAMSCDEEEDEDEEEEEVPVRRSSGGAAWPQSAPPGDAGRAVSPSSPPAPPSVASSCSSSSERTLPKLFVQGVEGETLSPRDLERGFESGWEPRGQRAGRGLEPASLSGPSPRHATPVEAEHHTPPPGPGPHCDPRQGRRLEPAQGLQGGQRELLSSSRSSTSSPASDAGSSSSNWPPSGSSRGSGWSSTFEDLQARTGEAGRAAAIPEVLLHTQPESVAYLGNSEAPALSLWDSTGSLHDNHDDQEPTRGWSSCHSSPGHLRDDQDSAAAVLHPHRSADDLLESSAATTSTPAPRLRPALARRLSREVKSRMCRSLGADLDQILQEEMGSGGGSEAARLNRLHMISSSLSLRANLSSSSLSSCSTPPRYRSLAELDEGVEGRGGRRSLPAAAASSSSAAQHEGHGRQPSVPLEPSHHTWLVKGAAGAWPDIYSLFREDSALLDKQDFISGFTVLHWIAKHGDHRVLNTLWYGVQKAGLTFNINARSACGHTPLHIAAMHSNKNIIRLLVKNFNADVKLRDVAGKRPWQYLSCNVPPDVFQLLGAPARAALGVGKEDLSWSQKRQPQHLRRHHLSSASPGERPLTITVTNKVKRSTSLAAFLKHKSLHPFHGHQSDSSV